MLKPSNTGVNFSFGFGSGLPQEAKEIEQLKEKNPFYTVFLLS